MPVAAFEPKFMKIGVLTAALQELTPREKRDPDPDLAVEEWAAFARELGADYMQLSAALHPSESDVPAEAMLDPVANTLDLRRPFDKERAKRVRKALDANRLGLSDLSYFDNMLHDDPAIRKKKHDFMRRVFDAAALLGVDAVCGFVGRNQTAVDGREPRRLRAQLRAAAEGGEGPRPRLPRRAVPDAGLDDGRQLAQQHRLHAGHLDRAAPHLREARRRRPVPHPLRPVARDPDGPGHALAVPVPEGRGLRVPDRRLPREGAGRRREGRRRVGLRRPDASSAATGRTASRRRTRRPGERVEEAGRAVRARAAGHRAGTTRSPTCRTGPSTGSTTSSPRASCCSSTSRTRTSSSSTSTRRRGSRTRSGSSRSCRARSPSRARSTRRRPACSRSSTRC